MRKLTFITFLERYIYDLTKDISLNIHKLLTLHNDNHRIREVTILYAVFSNKKEILMKYLNDEKEKQLINKLSKKNYLDDAFDEYNFKKIWNSYLNTVNRCKYNNDIKSKIRNKIVSLMKTKNITNYRVYKDLRLNQGNINDFLKNNSGEKVSLDTVKKIYNYVINY